MTAVLYVLSELTALLIGVILLLMFIRAILSWVGMPEENAFFTLVYNITDAVMLPMRLLLFRFEWVQTFPLDLSFAATVLALTFLQMLFFGM